MLGPHPLAPLRLIVVEQLARGLELHLAADPDSGEGYPEQPGRSFKVLDSARVEQLAHVPRLILGHVAQAEQ